MPPLAIEEILELALGRGATDVYIAIGMPVVGRISGHLAELTTTKVNPEDAMAMAKRVAPRAHHEELDNSRTSEFDFTFGPGVPFHASIFPQGGHIGLVMRRLTASSGQSITGMRATDDLNSRRPAVKPR